MHAELHASDARVRRAAIEALGDLGFVFGGAAVARWLKARDLSLEPPGTADAALLTLARTGHPDTSLQAEALWAADQVDATTVHLALAEAVSPALLDLARVHVSSPEAGIAAALHLSAVRAPDLPALFRPLLQSSDLEQVHVAERMLAIQHKDAEEEVMDLQKRNWEPAALARAARRLRVHPAQALVDAFIVMRDDHPPGSWPRREFVSRLMLTGVPELQAAILRWARSEGHHYDLARVLRQIRVPHEGLEATLKSLMRHAHAGVVVHALRARVNVLGYVDPDELARVMGDPRPDVQCEAVRSLMTLYRDLKGPDRRTGLLGRARKSAEKLLRQALRTGDPRTRQLAAYTVGNMGMTALTSDLHRLRTDPDDGVRQGAAASLHILPPSVSAADLIAWATTEASADVQVRLLLALEHTLASGHAVPADALRVLLDQHVVARSDLDVLSLRLCGYLRGSAARARLQAAAADGRLATASTALSALGVQADPAALPTLVAATRADDPVRRRRAVESLAHYGASEAGELLVAVACDDPEPHVRRAALRSLVVRPCDPASARRLVPSSPTDPLLFEILQARAAAGGGAMDATAVDARLVELLPGFRAKRLHRRAPDALQALRTAVFLDAGVAIPEGLDAAPPALFWVKGLELWLDVALRPLQLALRTSDARAALDGAAYRWSALSKRAAGWPADAETKSWNTLLGTLRPKLSSPRPSVLSLRAVAAGLLCTGPLAETLGLKRWPPSAPPEEVGALAFDLVRLADMRNRLSHRAAGRADEARAVRDRAVAAGGRIASLFP